ncbi:MAG TPA: hypothetical protein VEF04_14065, partial [Blastocatellia bacterium]|nr:hypothetical protein [Blastocatellia bacterium]
MKRREFMAHSSLALGALAVSDSWLSRVIAGEPSPIVAPVLETYFQVSKAEINKLLAATLSKGADFA